MTAWPLVSLGQLADFLSGGTPDTKVPEYYSGTTPWISSADISEDGTVYAHRFITEEAIKSSTTRICLPGSLLLVTRVGVGKACIINHPTAFSQDIVWIRSDNEIVENGYLLHFLRNPGKARLHQLARGATIQGVTLRDVKELRVPLPPLDEQRRIAGILDSATQLTRSTFNGRKELIDRLISSRFEHQFLHSGRSWTTIGEYLESTQYGTSSKAGHSGATPILRMGNITYEGQIDLSDLKYIDLTPKEEEKYDLRDGDLLFNRTNSKELVGKTAVYRDNRETPRTFAGYLIRARTKEGATPEYISAYLNSRHGKATLALRAKAIVGMANINATELKRLPLPAASPDEQKSFAAFYTAAEKLIVRASESMRLGDELYNSLATRAFAGEL